MSNYDLMTKEGLHSFFGDIYYGLKRFCTHTLKRTWEDTVWLKLKG